MRNVFYLILALVMVTGCTKQGSIADLSQDTAAPMASYPIKETPTTADAILIIDAADANRTKRAFLGDATYLGAQNGEIGDVVVWVDDGEGVASLPITVTATDVDIADSGSLITATTVEGALAEHRTAINLNTSKVTNTDDQTATEVPVTATGFTGNLSGTDTNVQTALATLDAMTAGSGTITITQQTADPTLATMETGDLVVATTSGDLFYKSTTGLYTIGGTFAAGDSTPTAFSFVDQTDVATSTTITSAAITVAGIDVQSAISVTGGTYDINASGTFTADAGVVEVDDTVRARHTSSGTATTAVNTVVTIGTVSDTFTSTTAAGGTTYDFFYDADHVSGGTYAYLSSGSVQGTIDGTVAYPAGGTDPGTASSDGGNVLKLNSWNASLGWAVTAGDIFDSSEGYITAEIYAASVNATSLIYQAVGMTGGHLRVATLSNGTITITRNSATGDVTCAATSTATIPDATWTTVSAYWSVTGQDCGIRVGAGSWVDGTPNGTMTAFTTEPTSVSTGHGHSELNLRPLYIDGLTVYTTAAP